jgi:hypothetical protein
VHPVQPIMPGPTGRAGSRSASSAATQACAHAAGSGVLRVPGNTTTTPEPVQLPATDSPASCTRDIAINVLVMSDTVLIPVRPTSNSLGGLPSTVKLIEYATQVTDNGSPTVRGLLLSEADRRTEQYRRYFSRILRAVAKGQMPKVFMSSAVCGRHLSVSPRPQVPVATVARRGSGSATTTSTLERLPSNLTSSAPGPRWASRLRASSEPSRRSWDVHRLEQADVLLGGTRPLRSCPDA